MQITEWFTQKKAIFITTKNLEYIRNTQEIKLLKENAKELFIIGSSAKSYPARLFKVFWKILITNFNNYDLVFIGFAPQLILPFFRFKFRKTEIIIDFFISMYDTMVCDRKKYKNTSLIARLLFYLDKKTLKLADKVIADTKTHGKYFSDSLQCKPDKIEVLYLEADTEIYYPRNNPKKDFSKEPFCVLYFGSILPLQGVEIVLKAVDLLKEHNNIQFEIIGPLRDQQKPLSDHVLYYDWLSQNNLAERIANADLCLAGHFSSEIEKAKRTIPGKAYIYHAMKKEMILGDNPANHELFSENTNIHFVEMGNANALAKKILEIAECKLNEAAEFSSKG